MKFVFLSGSFRRGSRSLALLAFVERYLGAHSCTLPRLDGLPFYSDDLSGAARPAAVDELVTAVAAADGLVVCTPEYNHSLPAVLKNAIDWASRPAFASVLKDKPVCIITQANGPVGGARAQAHLKLVLDAALARVQPIHEMTVSGVGELFDETGELIDAKTAGRLQRHLDAFVDFVAPDAGPRAGGA